MMMIEVLVSLLLFLMMKALSSKAYDLFFVNEEI